ncbi:kinase-like domain-containing protein [Pyrenochaeta sp. MPI-SDFR-AT-0127]|nr:kinase-like domain-containing protein [Pyrenochaeta sp. MPI-SDFR-AT-0127]
MVIKSRQTSFPTHHEGPGITVVDFSETIPSESVQVKYIQNCLDKGLERDDNEDISSDSEDENGLGGGEVHMGNVDSQDEIYGQDPEGQQRSDYKDLGTLLRRCGIQHADKRRVKRFWPTSLLGRILTRDRIVEELQAYVEKEPTLYDGKALHVLADTILLHHRKVFTILVLIGKGHTIGIVIKEQLKDKHLPLQSHETTCQLYREHRRSRQLRLVKCFSRPEWETFHRDGFSDFQYAVNPQILRLEEDKLTPKHEDFHLKVVLPFTNEEGRQQGGYGYVTEVKIHPDCHEFHKLLKSIELNDSFALKQLMKKDREEFETEAKALKRFNGFANDHMVTLLMTWTIDGSYYLLFPLAKCDLDEYWQRHPLPVMDAETILWTSKQIEGIASALDSIHNPPSDNLRVPEDHKYGRHGDLKPENILLYDSPDYKEGILVVADLGLSKLNSILSVSNQSNNKMHFTPRYKPPECDIDEARVTRSYDIWTFGCLLLEWVCWMFLGQPARAQFLEDLHLPYPSGSSADMFFDMIPKMSGGHQVIVKSHVHERLAELHADGKCTQYFHDLLYIIEEEMLVLRAKDRIKSGNLHHKLSGMGRKALQDSNYYRMPCEKPRQAKLQAPLDAVFKKLRPRMVQVK